MKKGNRSQLTEKMFKQQRNGSGNQDAINDFEVVEIS